MKTVIHAGKFAAIRSPLLPLSVFQDWSQSEDKEAFILELYSRPLVDEALYLSSFSLHARLNEFRRGEGDAAKHDPDRKKLIATLAKFVSRAAYRCTPFGLFAKIQYATVDNEANPEMRRIRRGIHLDSAIEARLIESALQDPHLREQLTWRVSNTANVIGSHLSYVDWVYTSSWQRTYRSVELDINEGLLILKNHCQSPTSFYDICQLLTVDPDISTEDAIEFLHLAIDKRLLLPDFAPSGSDRCSLDYTLAKCPEHSALQALRDIQSQLHAIRAKANSTDSLVQDYNSLQQSIVQIIGNKDMGSGVLQIDSVLEDHAHIVPETANALSKTIQLIAAHSTRHFSSLKDFKSIFHQRFEEREVNLAYALHPELGIPYPDRGWLDSELFDGIQIPREYGYDVEQSESQHQEKAIDRLLMNRLFENKELSRIDIAAEELEKLGSEGIPQDAVAEGLYAQINLLPVKPGEKQQMALNYLGGRSGLELLARFTYLNKDLEMATKEYARENRKEKEDIIYAEIVHHPQDRMLNILRRPRLYDYDIVFAGTSNLPREKQLWLDDLSIQLINDHLILRERKSGKQVIPRLSSAHNYSTSQLGAYQFLGMLQYDRGSNIEFDWPKAVRHFEHLPRVTIDGLIVAREFWTLKKADIESLNKASTDNQLDEWLSSRKLPRYVTYDQDDNHLPVDLHNAASVSVLLDEIIKFDEVQLHECLVLNTALESGNFSAYSQEWIMPLRVESESLKTQAHSPTPDMHAEGLICSHMDEWAYLRIYTGTGYSDRVLRDFIAPIFEQLPSDIDRWFFIRYKDKFDHIRIRFHSNTDLLTTLKKLHANLNQAQQDGLIWRVQSDDYVLEADRYGGAESLVLCEQLFCIDSQDVLALLQIEDSFQGMHQRWLYELVSIDHYAQILLPDGKERAQFLDTIANGYIAEHSTPTTRSSVLMTLGERYRELRKSIDAIRHGSPALDAWRAQLEKQRPRREQLLSAIHHVLKDASSQVKDIVHESLMHMHCNRLSQSDPRRHEAVLYDFARRLERARGAVKRDSRDAKDTKEKKDTKDIKEETNV